MRRILVIVLLVGTLAAWKVFGRSTHGVNDLATEHEAWWGDMARGYVVEGCLPQTPAPASLTLSLPPCRAYTLDTSAQPRRLTYVWEPDARSLTLPSADGRYWVGVHRQVGMTVPGWTRLAGTHYLWQMQAERPLLPDGMTLVFATDVSGLVITTVGDLRPDSPLPGAPANLRSPLFQASGDCASDDTAAVQTWINNVAWRNTEGYAPAGCYEIRRVWLTWDATQNPGFPSNTIDRGGYLLKGAGPAQVNHIPRSERDWPGTVWRSTATTAPALNAMALAGGGQGNLGRGIRLENLSVVQTTTSFVIEIDGFHSRSGLRDLFVVQRGTGGGLSWRNSFLTWMEDTFVTAQYPATNTGVGIHVANDSTPGGILRLVNVTARQFGVTCLRAGALAPQSTRLQTVHMQGVQGGGCPIGLQVWGGIRSLVCDGCYFEGFTENGVFIKENADSVAIVNSWFASGSMDQLSDAAIRIGTGGASLSDGAEAVYVRNNTFVDIDYGWGIWRDVGAAIRGAIIELNHLDVAPTAQGAIYCGEGGLTGQNDLRLFGNVFGGGHPAYVDSGCRSGESIHDGAALWMNRRLNLTQGSPVEAAPILTLPSDGNAFTLTGTATIATITCATCRHGAIVWFYVSQGNTPRMDETDNIRLQGTAWNGTANDIIGLMWTTAGLWVEMHRSDN